MNRHVTLAILLCLSLSLVLHAQAPIPISGGEGRRPMMPAPAKRTAEAMAPVPPPIRVRVAARIAFVDGGSLAAVKAVSQDKSDAVTVSVSTSGVVRLELLAGHRYDLYPAGEGAAAFHVIDLPADARELPELQIRYRSRRDDEGGSLDPKQRDGAAPETDLFQREVQPSAPAAEPAPELQQPPIPTSGGEGYKPSAP